MASDQSNDGNASNGTGRPVHERIRRRLARSVIAPDLREFMKASAATELFPLIIEFNSNFPGGARSARNRFLASYAVGQDAPFFAQFGSEWPAYRRRSQGARFPLGRGGIDFGKSLCTDVYAFARLDRATIEKLANLRVAATRDGPHYLLVYKIWRDHELRPLVYESVRTIKCDAARAAFGSAGRGIVWAVADTGVKAEHPHFQTHQTLKLPDGLRHRDFTQEHPDEKAAEAAALKDDSGHGSHVAGIIAGETFTSEAQASHPGLQPVQKITVVQQVRQDDQPGNIEDISQQVVSGIAPLCKIMSLKVLCDTQGGNASNLLAAIGYIQQINGYGRDIKVHGLNLSLGYPFDAAWFATGQSPLCAEVNRVVKSGVSVVVAAGNAGYGRVAAISGSAEAAAFPCTIADPGNADLAITVGSTHRSAPHMYGVSYFSSKGPTADGRMKPDLVAPGERIVSCAIDGASGAARYREDSGTSMAAPHVSAAIAAFLSVRGEFIGRPEAVKAVLLSSAMDIGRRPEFQGSGLLDLLKALQSV